MSSPAQSPAAAQTQANPRTSPPAFVPVAFKPRRGLRNGHLQTIVGNFVRRHGALPPLTEQLTVPVEAPHLFQTRAGALINVPQSSVLCLCHWQAAPTRCPTVILVHGLEGSASSGYIVGNTLLLWQHGYNVVRMNMRSCGGSDTLAPTIYHSGRSEDVSAVIETLTTRGHTRIALVGYSMGGNLVFRYAGQQAVAAVPNPALRAIAGVSPLLDLAPSSAALHLPANRLYEQRFLRAMKSRLQAKAALFPSLYSSLAEEGVYARIRTMRDFDGEIVARFAGFADAADYYEQVRASHHVAQLATPSLVLHALDDPFIRYTEATRTALSTNPQIAYIESAHGGHCAFLGPDGLAGDPQGRWAEATITQWLQQVVPI
jgi:predicted alpha/beta-fold hydrolase